MTAPSSPEPADTSWLERWFGIRQRGSTVRTEILGGATTFATMAYIIVVNPAILSAAGFPIGPSTVATILTGVFGTLLMGLYANRPLAVAPYMGENAFLAFGLMALSAQMDILITVEERLGTVFVSGLVFLIITLIRIRSWLADSLSASMKHSFSAGIGLFIAFIGLYETGIVTSAVEGMPVKALIPPTAAEQAPGESHLGLDFHAKTDLDRLKDTPLLRPPVPVRLGNVREPRVALAVFGFLLTASLMALRIRGAILLGMVGTAVLGAILGVGKTPSAAVAMPFVGDYSLAPLAFKLDVAGVLKLAFLPVLLTLVLISFLDTLGTLVGVADAGNMLDERGHLPDMERPMIVDALSCVFSSVVGTSTSGAYIESATGVREGARTGLAAVTTAALFAGSLFFIPLLAPLQELKYVYGPALIAVGVLMLGSAAKIDFADLTEGVPAFATIVMMVFTYNIANGLTAGLILYPVLKVVTGRGKELHPGAVVLAMLCLVYYVFGMPH